MLAAVVAALLAVAPTGVLDCHLAEPSAVVVAARMMTMLELTSTEVRLGHSREPTRPLALHLSHEPLVRAQRDRGAIDEDALKTHPT